MPLIITEGHRGPALAQAAAISNPEASDSWWAMRKGDRAPAVYRAVARIQQESASRRQLEMLHMAMYSAGNVAGEGLKAITRFQSQNPIRLRLNLAEAICDALQAKIAKIRPRPRFITTGGDWGLRKRAEAAEQALDGELLRNKVDELAPRVAVDAFVTGTGFFHTYRDGVGYPLVDRCAPGEVMVGYFDGLNGDPRTIYRARLVDREYLLEKFGGSPNSALYKAIQAAPCAPPSAYHWLRASNARNDTVYVVDAWHKGRKPLHVMVCGDAELIDDTLWEGKEFPIIPLRWKHRLFGYYGKGAVEEITPEQVEINYTLEKIQYILHNVSTVRYWIQAGNKIELNATRMSNFPGEACKYYGPTPPVKEVTDSVPRELWEAVDRAQAGAYKKTGISEYFSQNEKPAGLNSGEAQRVYEDVGDARMLIKGRAYEQAHMTLVERIVDVKREIANDPEEKETPVVVTRKRARGVSVRSLSFKDIDLSKTTYLLQVLEQSSLPGTPSGKTATVSEWIQIGLVDRDEGKELLNMPDVKAELSMSLATKDSVLSAIECIADEGEWYAPHSMMDLALAARLAMASYTRLEWEGLPEDRLEMLAKYIEELRNLTALATPPAQTMVPGGVMPGSAPGLPAVPGGMAGVPVMPGA